MKEDKPAASRKQDESRKIGNENRLKEAVKDAVENPACLNSARNARFEATGEPSKAPKK